MQRQIQYASAKLLSSRVVISYLAEKLQLDLQTKERIEQELKNHSVCYVFTYGQDLMNTLAFVCRFATAIINEEEFYEEDPNLKEYVKKIRFNHLEELMDHLIVDLKKIFSQQSENDLVNSFQRFKQMHVQQCNKTHSKYDRLNYIISVPEIPKEDDPKREQKREQAFTYVNMLKFFKCWTMQFNRIIQENNAINARFGKDHLESDNDFIEKLVLYSRGINYNFKIYYFANGNGDLQVLDVFPNKPVQDPTKLMHLLIADNKLMLFFNTKNDDGQRIQQSLFENYNQKQVKAYLESEQSMRQFVSNPELLVRHYAEFVNYFGIQSFSYVPSYMGRNPQPVQDPPVNPNPEPQPKKVNPSGFLEHPPPPLPSKPLTQPSTPQPKAEQSSNFTLQEFRNLLDQNAQHVNIIQVDTYPGQNGETNFTFVVKVKQDQGANMFNQNQNNGAQRSGGPVATNFGSGGVRSDLGHPTAPNIVGNNGNANGGRSADIPGVNLGNPLNQPNLGMRNNGVNQQPSQQLSGQPYFVTPPMRVPQNVWSQCPACNNFQEAPLINFNCGTHQVCSKCFAQYNRQCPICNNSFNKQ